MDTNSFFEAIENQYANKLPFVVYSRPINSVIKCWLQNDDSLNITSSFEESGFVFSPFDLQKPTILFPKNKCKNNFLEIDKLDVDPVESSVFEENSTSKSNHIQLVSKGINTINCEDLEKVVVSRFEEKEIKNTNPIEIFKRLFNTYKNAMVYCWYHPKVGLWLGATPELLFKVEGQQLTTISLAGTQAYNEFSAPKWTVKELKEQQIVTDFLGSQVAPYALNTNISEVETIRAGNLWHLKSRLKSRLSSSSNLRSIIEALHPTPAVCGFPKQKAMEFIKNNEVYNREFYTGFLGELNLKYSRTRNTNSRNVENNAYGSVKIQSNFYVNLRCMQLKNNKAIVYVGGGVTKDSNPENEWEETRNKAKTIGHVIG
jgi:isochorismate synthase